MIKIFVKHLETLNQTDWRPVYNLEDFNESYSYFQKKIDHALNFHFPLKTVEIKYNNRVPYITRGIRQSNDVFSTYSMYSLVASVLDSPAVDPRSNPGSGSALLMSESSQAVYMYYISSCHMLIDKVLSSDKPNGH